MRSVHRDDSSIIDSCEENKTYLGKEKRIGRPLQYRAASSLISSEKKRRKRDDNRPTLIPISSVYRKQGKENFAFDICSIQRIRIDIRRYSIRVHESTGFVREKCIVHSSVLRGWNILNQPAGRKLGFHRNMPNLASRRFTLLPHPHRPFASLKGIRKDFSTTVVDEIDRTSLESIFIGKNSTIFFFSTVYGY